MQIVAYDFSESCFDVIDDIELQYLNAEKIPSFFESGSLLENFKEEDLGLLTARNPDKIVLKNNVEK